MVQIISFSSLPFHPFHLYHPDLAFVQDQFNQLLQSHRIIKNLYPCIRMAPKSAKYTADDFEKQYGKLVREEYAEYRTALKFHKALRAHNPSICMTQGILKQWFSKYETGGQQASTAIAISSRGELEQKYGDVLHKMAEEHSYRF